MPDRLGSTFLSSSATAAGNTNNARSPTPGAAQPAAGYAQGHALRRTGSGGGNRPPSVLPVVREVSEEGFAGKAGASVSSRKAIPIRPQRPPVSRNSSAGSTGAPIPTQQQPASRPPATRSTRSAIPTRTQVNPVAPARPGSARLPPRTPTPTQMQPTAQANTPTTKTDSRPPGSPVPTQPQPSTKTTGKTTARTGEPSSGRYSFGRQQPPRPQQLQRPSSRLNRPSSPAASTSSSGGESDSSDDPNIHSRFLRRPPRFPLRDNPDDEDEPEAAFLPINHQAPSNSSSNDMGDTLRGHFGGLRSFGNRGSSAQQPAQSLSQTSDSSASSAAIVDDPRRTTATFTRTTTGARSGGGARGGGYGPISPRRTSELKSASREGSDGTGTPSMGSSFSDLDGEFRLYLGRGFPRMSDANQRLGVQTLRSHSRRWRRPWLATWAAWQTRRWQAGWGVSWAGRSDRRLRIDICPRAGIVDGCGFVVQIMSEDWGWGMRHLGVWTMLNRHWRVWFYPG